MIISISGKIGSGKDTVGRIIQWLIYFKNYPQYEHFTDEENRKTLIEFVKENSKFGRTDISFEIKKWADLLKDITCLFINCTREQLEDEEFKNTELGEQWWYYKVKTINGNYRLVNYLVNDESDDWVTLAYPRYLIKPTPRQFLQLLGTDCGRNMIHPNIWINSLMSKYKIGDCARLKRIFYAEHGYNDFRELQTTNPEKYKALKVEFFKETNKLLPNWIITDTRFPNEDKAVKDREGLRIRVNRKTPFNVKGELVWLDYNEWLFQTQGIKPHESETALDNHSFDEVIDNNGTIEELIVKVEEILIRRKILC